MAQLVFRCPYTNKPIFSGVEVFVESLRGMADYPISVPCPHCGFRHHGSVADGCLSDEVPAKESPPAAAPAALLRRRRNRGRALRLMSRMTRR
jgi:hypothetical protein